MSGSILKKLRGRRIDEYRNLFSEQIPGALLETSPSGPNSRDRVFSIEVTFWAFLSQVLLGVGCRGIVKRVQAWCLQQGRSCPSSNPSAYVQARGRLPIGLLQQILGHTVEQAEANLHGKPFWHGHDVKVVDGTGASMPDTAQNQRQLPQSSAQKPGCGFPVVQLTGLFSLGSGALLDWVESAWTAHEAGLWRKLWNSLKPNDIILADRAYCSFGAMAQLPARGVQAVFRLSAARNWHANTIRHLGPGDRLTMWKRPCKPTMHHTASGPQRDPHLRHCPQSHSRPHPHGCPQAQRPH